MVSTSTLLLLGLASQIQPAPSDPPLAESPAASAEAAHLPAAAGALGDAIGGAQDPNPAVSPSSRHVPAATAQSQPATELELPPEIPPEPSRPPDEVREHEARKDPPGRSDGRRADALDPPLAPPAATGDEGVMASACRAHEQAQTIRFAGMAVGLAGVLSAAAFAAVALYERGQAQALLDSSPAFGKVGDTYVQRDASHPDVASYRSHRDSASVMGQLGWVGLGISAAGLSALLTSTWIDAQLHGCPDSER